MGDQLRHGLGPDAQHRSPDFQNHCRPPLRLHLFLRQTLTVDPTARFSKRAEDYVRARPSYPAAVIGLLRRECGLSPQSIVADVGCGTGFLARLFCEAGSQVIGVEPNLDMRQAAQEYLSAYPNFSIAEGRAEETGLPAASADFITAGQAAHWFAPEP